MRIKLKITRHTSESELIHLGNFFTALGLNRGAHVTSGLTSPLDPAELDEPDVTILHSSTATELRTDEVCTIDTDFVPPSEAPKRKRRTKAEIEAANLPPEPPVQETEPPAPTEPEQAPAVETPAPTPDVQPQLTPPSETASTEPASASPSEGGKTYTHAEVQALAVDTARRYGPEKVKALIATYPNAAKIAELDEGDLAGFVAKLQAISA